MVKPPKVGAFGGVINMAVDFAGFWREMKCVL